MNAVLRIYLQPGVRFIIVIENFIDSGRAVALLRRGVFRQIDVNRDTVVLQGEMNRLILLMIGRREGNAGQSVKGHDTIRFRILDRLIIGGIAGRLVIRVAVLQGPGRLAAQQDLIDPRMQNTTEQSPLESGTYIARRM